MGIPSGRFKLFLQQIQSSRFISTLAVCLLSGLLVSATGCRVKSKVAEASRNLATKIANSKQVKNPNTPTNDPITEQRVYIDASLSMKGFVNPVQHSNFDEVLDAIGDALPGCKLYKYGQKGTSPSTKSSELATQTQFGLDLHQQDFYDRTYNPDDRLINELADEKGSALSVMITDGVYSEPKGSTAPPVVEAINRWMQNKKVFGILIFHSKFNGPFYSERLRGFLPSGPVPVEDRPFYVYVFSPTEQGFRELQIKLKQRFPQVQSILFSNAAVTLTVDFDEKMKGTYSFKRPPETNYYWQMFDAALFADKSLAAISYHPQLLIAPDYPISEFKVGLTSEYYRWERADFKKSDDGPPTGFNYESNPEGEKGNSTGANKDSGKKSPAPVAAGVTNLVVRFPKDTSCDYGFYALTLNLSPVSLRRDIQELSTRDDGVRANAGRTFRFFELVSALTDLHFKNQLAQKISPIMSVTISNK